MFTPARRNSTLGLNGLDAVRRDRIQNADPGGWFLCVAIPPRSGPLHTQSPPMSSDQPTEHSNGQLADGSIVDCRGGDGNAAVHQPPEASYTGKLLYLWDTWEMTKALAAIAALDASLLRPLFAPLLRELKATLRRAVDSMRDMEATEPLHDEMLHASLEYELFDAWKLTRALEVFRGSSGARLSSLFAPLLDKLETTLRSALDTIDELDAPLHGGPAATPPATNDRATEAPAELTPRAPQSETVENRALAMALRMITSGEKLSIVTIAKTLGCQRSFLYRCPKFQAFIKAQKNGRESLPRGRKDRKTRELEAWDSGD